MLGLVGAGGIGLQLNASIMSLAWTEVSMILLVIIATVVVSEWVSAKIRHAHHLTARIAVASSQNPSPCAAVVIQRGSASQRSANSRRLATPTASGKKPNIGASLGESPTNTNRSRAASRSVPEDLVHQQARHAELVVVAKPSVDVNGAYFRRGPVLYKGCKRCDRTAVASSGPTSSAKSMARSVSR